MSKFKFLLIIILLFFMVTLYLYYQEGSSFINLGDENNKNKDKEFLLLEKAKDKNSDVYAWINIPDTSISYPIVQHNENDKYYLKHDIENEYTIYGSIFTQKYNHKNFDDKLTIIYGHAMRDGSMFGDLKEFKKEDYFNSHDTIEIYFDNKKYEYKVIASYRESCRHIFSIYDLTDELKFQNYLDNIENISKNKKGYYRDMNLDSNSKLICLSTCNSSRDNRRWIVEGVLVDIYE